MSLHMFEKITQKLRVSGKNYVVICGLKNFCKPFCLLAKKFNFQLDGVIVIDDENPHSKNYSDVPIIDMNDNNPSPQQSLIVIVVNGEPLDTIQKIGYEIKLLDNEISLTNDDIDEMSTYFDLDKKFRNYFNVDDAKDYVEEYEKSAQKILNAYDEINFTKINLNDRDEKIKSAALTKIIGKKILQVAITEGYKGGGV